MPFIEALAQQMGGQAAGGALNEGMGLLFAAPKRKAQLKTAAGLQKLQIQGSKELTDYNAGKQLQMWKDTNYGAQVEQMKDAGINPALLYGMGGGGATANISQGNVGGQAAGTPMPTDGMGIQMPLMMAQIDLIKAQAEKTRAEIPNVPKEGVKLDTEIASLKQGITNAQTINSINKWEENLKRIESNIAEQTQGDKMGNIVSIAEAAASTAEMLERDNQIQGETKAAKIEQIKAESVQAVLKAEQIQVETSAIKERLLQGWKTLDNQAKEIKIKTFLAEYQSNHPGVMQVLGGAIQRIADGVSKPSNERKVN